MVYFIEVVVSLLLAVHLAESRGVLYYEEDFPADSACSGQPNVIPPWTGQPTFVRQIDNGSLYTAGDGDDMIHGTAVRIYYKSVCVIIATCMF